MLAGVLLCLARKEHWVKAGTVHTLLLFQQTLALAES